MVICDSRYKNLLIPCTKHCLPFYNLGNCPRLTLMFINFPQIFIPQLFCASSDDLTFTDLFKSLGFLLCCTHTPLCSWALHQMCLLTAGFYSKMIFSVDTSTLEISSKIHFYLSYIPRILVPKICSLPNIYFYPCLKISRPSNLPMVFDHIALEFLSLFFFYHPHGNLPSFMEDFKSGLLDWISALSSVSSWI